MVKTTAAMFDTHDDRISTYINNSAIIRFDNICNKMFTLIKVLWEFLTDNPSAPDYYFHLEAQPLKNFVYVLVAEQAWGPDLVYVGKGKANRPFRHNDKLNYEWTDENGNLHSKKVDQWSYALIIYLPEEYSGDNANITLEYLITEKIFKHNPYYILKTNQTQTNTAETPHGRSVRKHFEELESFLYKAGIRGIYNNESTTDSSVEAYEEQHLSEQSTMPIFECPNGKAKWQPDDIKGKTGTLLSGSIVAPLSPSLNKDILKIRQRYIDDKAIVIENMPDGQQYGKVVHNILDISPNSAIAIVYGCNQAALDAWRTRAKDGERSLRKWRK